MDNHFMNNIEISIDTVEKLAIEEFNSLHRKLILCGINVFVYDNSSTETPDAIFPNNWFSTHQKDNYIDSTIVLYPMKCENRRKERKEEIITQLTMTYNSCVHFEHYENDIESRYLEGTGVLILDRKNKIVYACESHRCSRELVKQWANKLCFNETVIFSSSDSKGQPIYHTNVLMSIGSTLAVICDEVIRNKEERDMVLETLKSTHEVLTITEEQLKRFCGNVIELKNNENKKILVMSSSAYNAYTNDQIEIILKHVDEICHSDIPTIEQIGGGSVRCMIAELF